MKGVVLSDQGSRVIVDVAGADIACVLRKSLRRAGEGKPVVVGDRVKIERSGGGAAVTAVEPRRSAISRCDPGRKHREQVLVANLDAVLVVSSVRNPDLVPGLIDRFLVAAHSRELAAGMVLNKIDLDPGRDYAPVAEVYRQLGYATLETSAWTGEGLAAVREFLAGRTTALLGHSGVGKSSLANALDSSLRLRTGEVHAGTGRGTHTTSAVSLLRLPWGGYLVDTPGIRAFGLWDMEPREIGFRFPEIARIRPGCRFSDCLHEQEPDCAVRDALAAGRIADWRYASYLRILSSLRERD